MEVADEKRVVYGIQGSNANKASEVGYGRCRIWIIVGIARTWGRGERVFTCQRWQGRWLCCTCFTYFGT